LKEEREKKLKKKLKDKINPTTLIKIINDD
jgi:hypothetical protein